LTTPTAARHSSKPLKPYKKKIKKKLIKSGVIALHTSKPLEACAKKYKKLKKILTVRIACYRSSVEPPTADRHSSKRLGFSKKKWTDEDPEINRL
jgi:hypothetical protein